MNKELLKLKEEIIHQDKFIKEMSKEMYLQQKEMADLKARLKSVEKKLENLSDQDNKSDNQTPPHY